MAAVAASRSDSFTRSSFRPRIRVAPSANGRGHRQDRIFVDHRRRALGRHLDALERAGAHAQVGDLLAAVVARCQRLDLRAHLAQRREQPGAQRIGHHPSRITSEPGTISAATSGNAADDGSAGTTTGAGSSSGWPCSVMRRPCSPDAA